MQGKVVQHPGCESTPQMAVAEAMGLADQMTDVCVMWCDHAGCFHIGWSKMSNADFAAYGVVLNHIAASRLLDE